MDGLLILNWLRSDSIMKIKEETIERIKQDWKIQTFQFDYIPHLKKRFVVGYLLFYIFTWVLMGVLKDDVFLLMQIPCLLSWNYFVFFDRKRKAYKDLYKPHKWEHMGTMFGTIGFSVMILLAIVV